MAATAKISITVGKEELRRARRLADKLGVSLSGFITQAVRDQLEVEARRAAAQEVLAGWSPEERATPAEMAELLARWREPPPAASVPRARTARRPARPRASTRGKQPTHRLADGGTRGG